MELDGFVDERPNPAGIRAWKPEPYAGTTVHADSLNNDRHSNYKAEQEGLLRFRFVLRPHGAEPPGAITAFSRDLEQPLVVRPGGGLLRLALRRSPRTTAPASRSSACGAAGSDRRSSARALECRHAPKPARQAEEAAGAASAVGGRDRSRRRVRRVRPATPPSARGGGRSGNGRSWSMSQYARVRDFMTKDPVTLLEDDLLRQAVEIVMVRRTGTPRCWTRTAAS